MTTTSDRIAALPARDSGRVSLSEVLSALSYALDLTEGAAPGHTLRTCLIGMRLANEAGLGASDRRALYYALLLKDAGCSSNAERMASMFGGDDRWVKPRMKVVDWHRRVWLALVTAATVSRGKPLTDRIGQFAAIARTTDMTKELIRIRCDRGADIARQLGFPDETADAIRSLDEHWCGLGYARGLKGDEIPLLARIVNIAQTVEVFHQRGGVKAAMRVARTRSGSWFDPALARIVLGWRADAGWWTSLAGDVRAAVVAAEPGDHVMEVDGDGLDDVCRAFADIIDAKSPFTYRHSTRVAELARELASRVGLDVREQRQLYRAGLLHDIGKLGVSNAILDKHGPLTAEEWSAMRRHPRYTLEILQRVSAFRTFAWTAALHHEKLDGSGYPFRLSADRLDVPSRILVVADVYDALTSDRPYRTGMTSESALELMRRERGTRLCATVFDALESAVRDGAIGGGANHDAKPGVEGARTT